jgi:hypothetical protein
MADQDAFSRARLSPSDSDALLASQDECSIAWTNDDGWPVAVIQTFLWHEGSLWITAFRDKPRVAAMVARPRAVVTVSSKGTDQGPERMISARVVPTVHDDDGTKAWFYPAFAGRTSDDPAMQAGMAKALSRQDRVIIELRPVSWNTFDGIALRNAFMRPSEPQS